MSSLLGKMSNCSFIIEAWYVRRTQWTYVPFHLEMLYILGEFSSLLFLIRLWAAQFHPRVQSALHKKKFMFLSPVRTRLTRGWDVESKSSRLEPEKTRNLTRIWKLNTCDFDFRCDDLNDLSVFIVCCRVKISSCSLLWLSVLHCLKVMSLTWVYWGEVDK